MVAFVGMQPSPNPLTGQMRFNTTTNFMETFDGTNWIKTYTVGNVTPYSLHIDEGRVYGARYYTVEPVNASAQWPEMMEWMVETFGPSPIDGVWTPGARWYANNAKFWFRNKKDLDWFVIRWSS